VTVPFWGTRAELAEVIALARAGRIGAHVERFSLDEASTAYERLHAGELRGRAVVVPGAPSDESTSAFGAQRTALR
jgi:propanol-preferring alcohol dehydrogenase